MFMMTEDRERIMRDWAAWWAGELPRAIVSVYTLTGDRDTILAEAPNFAASLPIGMPVDEVIERYTRRIAATQHRGDALPIWWPDFGPGIVAGFSGATVRPIPDETVWFEPVDTPLAELRVAYASDNFWWQRVRDLTRAAAARWSDDVTVGYTDLGGNLDILAHLRTSQQLLLDLYDAPDQVLRLVRETTAAWLCYHDELSAVLYSAGGPRMSGCRGTTTWSWLWAPDRTYMLQCDFSYMISPAMFERFAMPDLDACCRALPYSFYHLDGEGQLSHLDMLLDLPDLDGVQWVPGRGWARPAEYLPVVSRIRAAGKLCQCWGITPEAALTIVKTLGGRGFAFVFDDVLPADEADDFVALMARESRA